MLSFLQQPGHKDETSLNKQRHYYQHKMKCVCVCVWIQDVVECMWIYVDKWLHIFERLFNLRKQQKTPNLANTRRRSAMSSTGIVFKRRGDTREGIAKAIRERVVGGMVDPLHLGVGGVNGWG